MYSVFIPWFFSMKSTSQSGCCTKISLTGPVYQKRRKNIVTMLTMMLVIINGNLKEEKETSGSLLEKK